MLHSERARELCAKNSDSANAKFTSSWKRPGGEFLGIFDLVKSLKAARNLQYCH